MNRKAAEASEVSQDLQGPPYNVRVPIRAGVTRNERLSNLQKTRTVVSCFGIGEVEQKPEASWLQNKLLLFQALVLGA